MLIDIKDIEGVSLIQHVLSIHEGMKDKIKKVVYVDDGKYTWVIDLDRHSATGFSTTYCFRLELFERFANYKSITLGTGYLPANSPKDILSAFKIFADLIKKRSITGIEENTNTLQEVFVKLSRYEIELVDPLYNNTETQVVHEAKSPEGLSKAIIAAILADPIFKRKLANQDTIKVEIRLS